MARYSATMMPGKSSSATRTWGPEPKSAVEQWRGLRCAHPPLRPSPTSAGGSTHTHTHTTSLPIHPCSKRPWTRQAASAGWVSGKRTPAAAPSVGLTSASAVSVSRSKFGGGDCLRLLNSFCRRRDMAHTRPEATPGTPTRLLCFLLRTAPVVSALSGPCPLAPSRSCHPRFLSSPLVPHTRDGKPRTTQTHTHKHTGPAANV